MLLGDSSVWIDDLGRRDTGAAPRLRASMEAGELVTTDAVVMEVLAGVRSESQRRMVARLLDSVPRIPTEAWDFGEAAAIYRACRHHGVAPRSLVDCLIAAVARRVDAAVLHNDRDFDLIAEHVELRVER